MKIVSKSSFTLFELLIVLLLISVLYAVFVQRLVNKKEVLRHRGIEKIATILGKYDFNESATFLCVKRCKECFIYLDGKRYERVDSPFETVPKVYDYNIYGLLSQLSFTPLFDRDGNPMEVCFAYSLYPNGSASSYIVEYKKDFFIFYAYLHPPKKVTTLQEAVQLFDPSRWVPTESEDYNF